MNWFISQNYQSKIKTLGNEENQILELFPIMSKNRRNNLKHLNEWHVNKEEVRIATKLAQISLHHGGGPLLEF